MTSVHSMSLSFAFHPSRLSADRRPCLPVRMRLDGRGLGHGRHVVCSCEEDVMKENDDVGDDATILALVPGVPCVGTGGLVEELIDVISLLAAV